jgi:hypothetical protein
MNCLVSRLSFHVKNVFRLFTTFLLFVGSLHAIYIPVYTTNDNGGISWTGNTLGLNKANNVNQPGTSGSIGAFITTNTVLKVGNYPAGTTLNWAVNSSQATLDIPPHSTILHAELIWSGSYGFEPAISGAVLDTPIRMITPDTVSHIITPNPLTAQSRVNAGSNGFYVRSADVTSLVTQGGIYTVGGVPATIGAAENNLNCAGWTLAVVYKNPNMLTSNLTLFVACEASGAAPALVNGFHAPDNGAISSRLFVSALEGDAAIVGDRFLVGATLPLIFPDDALSGSNNPSNNFFASQINTLLPLTVDVVSGKLLANGASLLDQRGTFGSFNSNASTGISISGARQGYDITSADLANKVVNSQEQIYAQGTTTGDVYTINAVGVQIQVFAPIIQSNKQVTPTTASLNDVLNYTITFTNIGESIANSLIFKDLLPIGLTLNPNSFRIDGVLIPNPDLVAGVPLGNLGINDSREVTFQATIIQTNPPISFDNAATIDYSFTPFNSQTPVNLTSQTNTAQVTTPLISPPVATPNTGVTSANIAFNGTSVIANDTGTNLVISSYDTNTTQNGFVNMQLDGTYIYTPPTNFSGIDTFNYTIQDSVNQTATSTVTITVLPVALGDTGTVAANTPFNQTVSVLNNDIGTNLTIDFSDNTSVRGGTVTMQANGTYLYTPPANFSGIDTFSYRILDAAGNTAMTTVRITVLPLAENDIGTTLANTALNGTTVFTNDVGTGLTLIAYDSVSTQGGTVVMNMTDGTYIYTPFLNFSGIDTFTYTDQDQQGNTLVATVTITVLPTSVNDAGTTNANTILNQNTSVLNNDAGSGLTVTSYSIVSVQGGSVNVQPAGTYTYQPPLNFSGTDRFSYTATDLNGSSTTAFVIVTVLPVANNNTAMTPANTTLIGPSVLNNNLGTGLSVTMFQNPSTQGGLVAMNVDGTYIYQPPLNFSGIDTFSYMVTDSSGNMSVAVVTITVLPVANSDTGSTPANTNLSGNVLTNDEGLGLSVTSGQFSSSQGGSVIINQNGDYSYQPPLNFSGIDSFTYTVTDSTGNSTSSSVNITVFPLAVNNSATTQATVLLNGSSLLANDIGNTLQVTSYQNPSMQGGTVLVNPNGTYTYQPPANYSGLDTFTYTVTDPAGSTSTATVTITVLPLAVNDIVRARKDTMLNGSSVLANDVGNGLSVVERQITTNQGGLVFINAAGIYIYRPPAGFVGIDSFTYTIIDSAGNTSTANVVFMVAPFAINNNSFITPANIPLNSVIDNQAGSNLTITNYSPLTSQGGTVVVNPNGTFIYQPPVNFSGIDTFTYTARDLFNGVSQATISIRVLPVANNDQITGFLNTPLNGPSVLANDIGSGLHIINFSPASTNGGSVVVNSDGTYIYTPPANFTGPTDTFTYLVADAVGNVSEGTVTISLLGRASSPQNFRGMIQKQHFLNETQYHLTAKWESSADAVFYRIYYKEKLASQIRAGFPLIFTVCLDSTKAAKNYSITAVNSLGIESIHTPLRITND